MWVMSLFVPAENDKILWLVAKTSEEESNEEPKKEE